ncbi:MAG: ATP-binding protein [Alphaproteobacteria bacterium]|nr:ATP-binding protein [Alphaproteobacteria bacterium]
MSIKLKILLAVIPLAVLFAAQTGLFYFQQKRFDAFVSKEFSQSLAPVGSFAPSSTNDGAKEAENARQSLAIDRKEASGLIIANEAEVISALLGALILGGIASFLLIESLVPPLNKAIMISNAIAVGYLENEIKATGNSETDELLRSLAAIQQSRAEINDHLERQISETETAYADMQTSALALNAANASLSSLNASMDIMLNALNQGLFSFGADGICSSVSSKACLSLLESAPAGRRITDVLHIPPEEESVDRVLKLIFSNADPDFDKDDLLALLPDRFERSDGTKIALAYHPIVGDEKKVRSILAVATDHSAEESAVQLMRDQEAAALSVLRISGNRNLFIQFYNSISGFFLNLDEILSEEDSLDMLRRDLHTFKGNAAIFHLQDIVDALHGMEDRLAGVSDIAQARQAMQTDLPKFQAILTKTHKLAYDILGRTFDQQGVTRTLPLSALAAMADRIRRLSANDNLYKDFVETLMGEPVRNALSTFDISLHELADRYGKKVSPCYFTGDNFLLLTENYHPLFAAFIHIARNIVSHAIDSPKLRVERHKDPELTVVIETKKFQIGNQEWFRISFEDDGCGLNVPLLRKKLAECRSEEAAARLTDAEVMNGIFNDNLSTRQHVDALAGRGVGLSAVKHEAGKLGGKVSVESEWGVYTRIIIEAPFDWSARQKPDRGGEDS